MDTQNIGLLKSIQTTVAASRQLQEQLAKAKTTDEAASLLSVAMSTPVSAAKLAELDKSVRAEMTEEQLDGLSGGKSSIDGRSDTGVHNILCSVLSAGIVCLIKSISEDKIMGGGACKKSFE